MNRSFVLLQPEGTGFCRLGPVFFKGWERGNRLQSGFSRLGQKTGPSRTFKHYVYSIVPRFVHTDKDMAEIGASRHIWPKAKHQLCWWHQREALQRRL